MALSARSLQLLEQLPAPKPVFQHFLRCTEIPRRSHNLGAIQQELLSFGKQHGLECALDKAGNVRLRKAASPGKQNAVAVVIQSHMDMVCSKLPEKVHDFDKDPIIPQLSADKRWMAADRTTLGADDGIGVAAALALLTDTDLVHGPLEAVFTADEETTMGGAEFMDQAPFLQADYLINVDSEEEHRVCVGCAGGFEKKVMIALERAATGVPSGVEVLAVAISGFRGGHTGIDIDKGRANAIKILARILSSARTSSKELGDLRLLSFTGGNAPNAIPRDAKAVVAVPGSSVDAFKKSAEATFAEVRKEFAVTEASQDDEEEKKEKGSSAPKMKLVIDAAGDEESKLGLWSDAATQCALDFVLAGPHGVIRMSPEVPGLVDTSISMSEFTCDADGSTATINFFSRSSSDHQMQLVEQRLDALVRLSPSLVTTGPRYNYFPGWEPDVNTELQATVVSVHKELFGKDPDVYAVHAGLECGLLQGRYPSMKCVSIGPTIEHAHSPQERLNLPSVDPFFRWLRGVVAKLADVPKPQSA